LERAGFHGAAPGFRLGPKPGREINLFNTLRGIFWALAALGDAHQRRAARLPRRDGSHLVLRRAGFRGAAPGFRLRPKPRREINLFNTLRETFRALATPKPGSLAARELDVNAVGNAAVDIVDNERFAFDVGDPRGARLYQRGARVWRGGLVRIGQGGVLRQSERQNECRTCHRVEQGFISFSRKMVKRNRSSPGRSLDRI
jgi:hypothetical protein